MSEILSPESDLSARRGRLSEAKRDLLARKLQRRARDLHVVTGAIPRRPDAAGAPLSFSQQRLWFLDQLEAGSASYNCPVSVRLSGTLERAALEWSLAEIVRRHDSLRTTFANVEGKPLQLIAPSAPGFPLPLVDLAGLPAAEREAEARRLALAERLRPFELARGPLVRVTLVRLAAQDHAVFSTIHHIVSDGWSMGILVRELGALYPAARAGLPSPLPGLPIQYADFAHWQRERLQGRVLAAEVELWRQRLAGAPPVLDLPMRERAPGRTPRGRIEPLRLSASLSAAARALGQGAGATPFMVLLAVLDLLLSRYTGEVDLVVGTSTANRNRVETRDLIGFFINILVLRCLLAEAAGFRTLLGRVREVAIEAYAHEDLPFEKLVEALQPERSLHHTPLFQVMFLFQNTPDLAIELPGLSLRPFDVEGTVPKFELTFELADTAQGFRGGIEYDANLFEPVTVARLARHFEALLECAVAAPDGAPFAYPMLSAPEVAQLLTEWNDTHRAHPAAAGFTDLYAAQVERTPDAVAIAGEQEALSYAELARRAHRLARRLAGRGIGGDRVVALLADRGPDLLTGILGVFAAGGAYLPLDTLHPPRRMGQVLERSRASLVLAAAAHGATLSAALAELPAGKRPEVLLLAPPPAGAAVGNLPLAAHGESLAYVIYTSGSTGAPKGAMVEQRGMMNHLWAKVEALGLQAGDTVAQTASPCFDISVWQFLAALLVGGRVQVLSDDATHDPVRLLAEVERHGVSILETVPSLLAAVVGEIARGRRSGSGLAALRWLIPTGEALPPELCCRWFAELPAVPLLNAYGPTECSDDVAHWALHQAPDAGAASVPIGRPVANLRLHLLDRDLGLVPVAATGDLYVGGIGVGRGYRGDPARTAEVFRPDPFAAETGGRLYRTGDLARRRVDGSLEFLGRADHQVKVRGFRIELGEIEAELGRHPAVQEAVVLALGEGQGRRLVAYLVPRGGQEIETPGLRGFLLERLPDYMVPSAFVPLAAMPLTPNAKVDRRALAAREPAAGAAGEGEASTAPRTPVEGVLAGIWGHVLGRDRVDVEASFFDLGGHSLLATQVIARVRQAFAVELPLRKLFERPTVAGLALEVEAALRAGRGLEAPPLVRTEARGDPLPLSFAQQRLWFLDQLAPEDSAYNVHLAVRLEGPLDGPVLAASLSEVVRRHESLRTTFAATDGEPVQRIGTVAAGWGGLPVADFAGLPPARREAEARLLATAEARRPFQLGGEPLLRTRLLRLGEREHLVVTTVHHIVSDGWSLGLLVQEVSILYAAFAAARPSPLAELPVQYADFALWQRRWLTGDLLERHLAYWRDRLSGAPALLELPTDRPRPAMQVRRGASRPVRIPAELAGSLRELGRRQDVTLFMTLLAGFQVLLSRYARQDDVSVGTPIAGRTHVEIEPLIGFFVNTLVLRADVGGEGGFLALLEQVRETALAAHLHQDVPFEKLVEELAPQRSLSHSPLFQVMFALQTVPRRELAAAGLRLCPFAVEGGDAKFDLTLILSESADELGGVLEYDRELFDGATIERLIGHFLSLVAAAAADPGCSPADLPLLGSAERQALLECNGTAAAYPQDACLHELIEAQVERTPEAVALVCEDAALSYRELDARANRLARRLRHLGVGPETPVGVCLERSLDLVVALLGILKAGGAYLPLDFSYPRERLSQMLEDSLGRVAAPVLLTERKLTDGLPGTTARVLCLDALLAAEAQRPCTAGRPASGVTPLGLAYVIFTSGSTGRPKGVMNTHRGIVNRLLWMQQTYALTPADCVLQKTPYSFDVSVWETLWPLLVGARLVVARPGGHRDAAYLVRTIAEAAITTVHFVPAMLQVFLEEPGVERCASLRRVMASGEALPFALAQRFFARLGQVGAQLHNLYGPTEAAVDVTSWPCRRDDARALVPIGRPVANTEIHLLDGRLRPVPIGVPGELYIGGVQVARGYYGRSDLTAERFLPDPFTVQPGARLYRTGDLARYLPGGEIDYLGRTDHQVKIRGLRIELGEIEATLGRHPGVQEATVLAVPGASGAAADQRLVAYLVPAPRRAPVWARQRLERQGRLGAADLHELPNGMVVAHRNRGETEFLYQEIFAAQGYLRHGIELAEGDCIFDVGANIGLFTLFAGQRLHDVTFYAFEPIPPVFEALRTNVALYGLDARLFDCGLASTPGSAELTYYPHATLISGRYADPVEERAAVRSSLGQQAAAAAVSDAEVETLLAERLRSERVTCRLRTVSEIMADDGVTRIDLLKIDVEKAEMEVLGGIREEDWPKLRQVVVEVHDLDGRLAQVTGLLERHGFVVAMEQDSALAQTVLYNLYARRPGAVSAAARPAEQRFWCSVGGLIADLRESVKRALPEHMVPSSFVVLEALPLSPNGKVDRSALAGLAGTEVIEDRQAGFVPPRGPVEELVAEIWREILGVARVGAHDHFFDLGGHSLLAMRLLSRLRSALGVELPLRTVFEAPTVARLAVEIERALGRGAGLDTPPIRPVEGRSDLPLSFAQERLWFLDRLRPGGAEYNLPAAVWLSGRLEPSRLAASLAEVVRRHEVLRTTFAVVSGRAVQMIAPDLALGLPLIDLGALPAAAREALARRLAAEQAARPFDLARGPLLRALLLRLGAEQHLQLLTLHHVIADGWSMGVLVRELAELYCAFAAGRPSPLPELPIQYADFAVWQRQWLTGAVLEAQLGYWRERLAGAPEALDLPLDQPRPAAPSLRGAQRVKRLPAELGTALADLSRRQGATRFMTLFAAWTALLRRHTGQCDLSIGTPIANRTRAETEGLIGFFVNTLVLRTDLAGDPAFTALLAQVREVALGAYTHQDLPFQRLVQELRPDLGAKVSPLFQVMFVYEPEPAPPPSVPGLTLRSFEVEDRTAQFDLTLLVRESPEGLAAVLNYGVDLFRPDTIQRLLDHFAILIEGIAAAPACPMGELPLLAAAERHQLLLGGPDAAAVAVPEAAPGGGRRLEAYVVTAARAAFVPPSLPGERLLAELWSEVLKLDRIGAEDDFFDLGGNSIQAAVLTSLLEQRLGEPVPIAALFEAPTLSGLARYLEDNGLTRCLEEHDPAGDTDVGTGARRGGEAIRAAFSPLVALQPRGSRPPLFLVHPVGGNVFCYAGLARRLGEDQPVFGLQSAGLSGGAPRLRLEDMASAYLEAVRAAWPQGPYHLAGWSVGGVVAYELAQQLRHGGEEVGLLALLDSQAPHGSVEAAAASDDFDLFLLFAGDLGGLAGRSVPLPARELARLPEAARLAELMRLAEAAGVLPEGLSRQQALRLWQVFRANFRAARAYRPTPYPGRMILFRAGAGDLGWTELAAGGLAIHRLAGDHYALLREPAVSSLARSLTGLLAAPKLLVSSRKTHDDL